MDNNYDITNGDWNREHNAYWSSSKTVNDPCPPGWKVVDGYPNYLTGWPTDYVAHVVGYSMQLTAPLCEPDDSYYYAGCFSSFDEGPTMRVWTNSGSLYGFYTGRMFINTYLDWDMDYNRYIGCFNGGMARIISANVRCQKIKE